MRSKTTLVVSAFACALFLAGGVATAADQTRDRDQLQTQDKDKIQDRDRLQDKDKLQDKIQDQDRDRDQTRLQDDQIYGKSLMTQQEINQYRSKVQAAKTNRERARIESQHRAQMQSRAKSRGLAMPPDVPAGKRPGGGSGAPGGTGPSGSGGGGRGG